MSASLYMFDRDAFADTVYRVRKIGRGLSMDHAVAAIGVTKAQLFRAEHRRPINNEAFLIICEWIGVSTRCFLKVKETGKPLQDLPPHVPRGELGETNKLRQSHSVIAARLADQAETQT